MNKVRPHRLMLAVSLCAAVGLSACSSSSGSSNGARGGAAGGTASKNLSLTVGQTAGLKGNFNPYNLVPSNFVMMYQVYDTLIRESNTLKPEPRLATSWTVAADGLSMTLQLRSAEFSNGKPITSQDVAYDINLVKQKKTAANIRVLADNISSVDTPTQSTVVLHFVKPFPGIYDFLNLLFITDQATVSSNYMTVDASGPFEVASYNPGVSFTLQRNPHFWGSAPALKTVTVKVLPDEQTLVESLKTRSIQVADLITPFNAKELSSDSSVTTGVPPQGNSNFAIALNVSSSPLNNIDVRQALSLALDREKMVTVALDGFGQTACLPFIAPTQLGYYKSLAHSCRFSLAGAKAKIQQSGLKNISFTLVTSTQSNPVMTQMAQIFQADLAKIGVTMHISDVASAAWNADAVGGTFQALIQPYGRANLDPSTLFSADTLWYPTGNNTHFTNSQYTTLVHEADTSTNTTQRQGLYKQIDQIILQQDFALPIASNPRPYATLTGVKGLDWAVNGQPLLEGVTAS